MKIDRKFCQSLDWNLLKTFHEIVEANGVTAAANAVWRKQSTISLALKRLEEHVGRRLCRRGRAGFELTDEGAILFEFAREIYGKINEIPFSLDNAGEVRGRIRISTISNFVCREFDDLLVAFNERCPRVEIDVAVATWESVSRQVLRNEADIGVAPIFAKYQELRYDFLNREVHTLYCGRRHHLFGKRNVGLDQLSEEPLVLTGADEPESLTRFRLNNGLGRVVAAVAPNLEEARRLTVVGLGICLLPMEMMENDVANGAVWSLAGGLSEASCDVHVITNAHAPRRLVREIFLEEVSRRTKGRAEVQT